MKTYVFSTLEKFFFAGIIGALYIQVPCLAQVIPDDTLGSESSRVTPLEAETDRIDGGAIRDSVLFHSFESFSIPDGHGVYFANPEFVNTIFSRVTGADPSLLFGTLGVLGNADLMLINPNGILFGPNAELDLNGAFTATTATGVAFPGGEVFSALEPEAAPLLTVNVAASVGVVFEGLDQGTISNEGYLSVPQDLALTANNLDLQGQLIAGGDLTLQGQDTVQIRDSAETPFIAAAGGQLTVQGNQLVDIFALHHPDSGLFSGGDMVLRSTAPIVGDAHYWSRGSFHIEDLDGDLGDFISVRDPIIRSQGDVNFFAYVGASLHIISGGSVNIGAAIVTQADDTGNSINPVSTPGLSSFQLSDSLPITIDGSGQATLDIRAGVAPNTIGLPLGFLGNGSFFDFNLNDIDAPANSEIASGSDIRIDYVEMRDSDSLVLLTNQYEPNLNIEAGDIIIGGGGPERLGIDTRSLTGNSGSVFIDARGNIEANNTGLGSISTFNSGDIRLIADRNINLDNQAFVFNRVAGNGTAGNIHLAARQINLDNGSQIGISGLGTGNLGDISILASDSVNLRGNSAIANIIEQNAFGDSGDIDINSNMVSLSENSNIFTIIRGEGNGGDINIRSFNVEVLEGSRIGTDLDGRGNSGRTNLNVSGIILVDGEQDNALGGIPSKISSLTGFNSLGNSGGIFIDTGSLFVTGGAEVDSQTSGMGDAGSISIDAQDIVVLNGRDNDGFGSGIFSRVDEDAVGNGAEIRISTDSLYVTEGGRIDATTRGEGNSGSIRIVAQEEVLFDGLGSTAATAIEQGIGDGGNIEILAQRLTITNGAQLLSDILGTGDAGDIILNVESETIIFDNIKEVLLGNIRSNVEIGGSGNGGNIFLTSGSLAATNASLFTFTSGDGNGGNVNIKVRESTVLENSIIFSGVIAGATGFGGDIQISSNELSLSENSVISTSTLGRGRAGNVLVDITDVFSLDGGGIFTDAISERLGAAGTVGISSGLLQLDNGSTIASESASGNGGDIFLDPQTLILRRGSQISTTAGTEQSGGNGGNIIFSGNFIFAIPQENSDITANAFEGNGGRIEISANGIFGIEFRDEQTPLSDITATSELGDQGIVTIATLDTDPTQGIDALPEEPREPEVIEGCTVRGNTEAVEFFDLGRGGRLPRPDDLITTDATIVEWTSLDLIAADSEARSTLASTPIPYLLATCGSRADE